MSNIDELLNSFERYAYYKKEEREAFEQSDKVNWGYYGTPFTEQTDLAKQNVKKQLDKYVDTRIVKMLTEKKRITMGHRS